MPALLWPLDSIRSDPLGYAALVSRLNQDVVPRLDCGGNELFDGFIERFVLDGVKVVDVRLRTLRGDSPENSTSQGSHWNFAEYRYALLSSGGEDLRLYAVQ